MGGATQWDWRFTCPFDGFWGVHWLIPRSIRRFSNSKCILSILAYAIIFLQDLKYAFVGNESMLGRENRPLNLVMMKGLIDIQSQPPSRPNFRYTIERIIKVANIPFFDQDKQMFPHTKFLQLTHRVHHQHVLTIYELRKPKRNAMTETKITEHDTASNFTRHTLSA